MTPPKASYRKIKLTKGKVTFVDGTDFEWLNRWKWHAQWNPKHTNCYAVRRAGNWDGTRTQIFMHRLLLGLTKGDGRLGDHKNRDSLDNRRANLRVATMAQNRQNSRMRADSSTGYKGVRRSGKKWMACIYQTYIEKYLGTFPTKQEAALAYNSAALKLYGEFAVLNVIETKP